jgi:tetratricopeptide (TPR) repeat protein
MELLLRGIGLGEISLACALGLHPIVQERLADKANALIERGKLSEGVSLLEERMRADRISPALPLALAACEVRRGESMRAIAAYTEAIARAERAAFEVLIPGALLARASAASAIGRLSDARADLELLLGRYPTSELVKQARAALSRLAFENDEAGP